MPGWTIARSCLATLTCLASPRRLSERVGGRPLDSVPLAVAVVMLMVIPDLEHELLIPEPSWSNIRRSASPSFS